jgi:hypothetical protein
VKLERTDENGNTTSSVFLDFDELSELMEAFGFIRSIATELRVRQRDYTEVAYSTKDHARFGFYQSEHGQQAFIALNPHSTSTFLAVEHLSVLKQLLRTAQEHLVSRGANNV